ncbi:xanthine/uracil/vitamin C permease [Gloeobacter kilaueensis]|uniref:Xanthine/uracil/vitamin C permease n=1 Tax=Gloeobacter kilaueensis (strain ATCC BAA-2537 / CCAP 1431/1 / ULC 316 / JS1) TaxID=1183438 RepID=U5QJS1_GLOK1|nr:xanthine/uracil/vitamin C permease [Gloeobacter kilaueensis]AGY57900.1 xanthine/uracil/vitamin C permease [Gloeobacter kilaueensis JS1]
MTAVKLRPRWLVRGDIDGFFGLALDNLIQILLIVGLCQGVLGFSAGLLYGRVLPGVALSLLVGNLYYSWLAYRVAAAEGRDDVTALPYGINTVSLFAHVFLVMLPVKLAALAGGAGAERSAELAWQAGLVACLGSGLIELAGSTVADTLRRLAPRAALLSTLGGIALTFIAIGFLFRTYAAPLVGMLPLAIILLTYFGGVRFGLPGGLVSVLLGTALAWATGLVSWDSARFAAALSPVGFYLPGFWLGDLWAGRAALGAYVSVILPMGLFNLVGSLQNLESAEAAGDRFPTAPCLAVNGLGSVVAAVAGSCFPTTIYIGHPGWKALGARVGYSVLNGVIMGALCLSGTVALLAYCVPIEAGMAIVLWIGIVIAAQAFTATPPSHAPAVVVGLLPGIAGWGALIAKNALRAAGLATPDKPLSAALVAQFRLSDTYIDGAFALEQGFIFSAMILSAITVYIVERQFGKAALWALAAAALSWVGLMHSYQWTPTDTVILLRPGAAGNWAIGYLLFALALLYAQWAKSRGMVNKP